MYFTCMNTSHPRVIARRPRSTRAVNPDLNRAAEDRVVAEVKLGRELASQMSASEWLENVHHELERALVTERATQAERNALALELHSPSSEPARAMQAAFAKRELPAYAASALSSWVVRQRPAYRARIARDRAAQAQAEANVAAMF
jgi:hypothetical protein